MMQIGTIIRSILSRIILIVFISIIIVPAFLMMLLPERIRFHNRFLFWLINMCYWVVLKLSLVPITYKGAVYSGDQSVIFVANHQSSLDIPLLASVSHGKPHIWLARAELMKWRWLKWVLPRLAVVVDVNSRQNSTRSLLRITRLVHKTDIDIMIFPEGGRYIDGEIHNFFGGFAILAKLLKRPVVPVRIFGVNKVYPPHSFLIQYHPITVVVGEPMYMGDDETDEEFKDRVYRWFIAQKE